MDLQGLKLRPAVSLYALFPMPPVWLKLDSPRKSFAPPPKMTCLYTFSVEWTCTKLHALLFWPSDLKTIHRKAHSMLFLYILTKFQSDAQRERYDDFPKVTYLERNLGVCKNPNFFILYLQTYSDTRSEIQTLASPRFRLKWVLISESKTS